MTPLSALAIDGVFDRARLARTAAELEAQVDAGLELGGQLFLALRGEVVADAGFGAARPGEPMRRDHLMLWMSSTKPVAAVAICQLWERGRLELDDPVALHIPEFAQGGKERVTVRHLLTHTGGLGARDCWIGMPAQRWREYGARMAPMFDVVAAAEEGAGEAAREAPRAAASPPPPEAAPAEPTPPAEAPPAETPAPPADQKI